MKIIIDDIVRRGNCGGGKFGQDSRTTYAPDEVRQMLGRK